MLANQRWQGEQSKLWDGVTIGESHTLLTVDRDGIHAEDEQARAVA